MHHPLGPQRLLLTFLLPLAFANLGTGCGAMFNDDAAVVAVRVNPAGAQVYVDDQLVGQAPVNVSLPATTSHSIDAQAPGYDKQTARLEARVRTSYLVLDCVLLLFGLVPGIVALAVDGISGDWRVPERDSVSLTLIPFGAPHTGPVP